MRGGLPIHTSNEGSRMRVAAALASLVLCGCACGETDWDTAVFAGAEASEALAVPDCDAGNLARFSKISADLVGRADPHMLEIARLEAERDCYKAAERRARQSLESLQRR